MALDEEQASFYDPKTVPPYAAFRHIASGNLFRRGTRVQDNSP